LNTILGYFLPAYLIIYFGIAFFWRSFVTWKRTGINPYAFGKTDNTHDFVGRLFRLTLLASVVVVAFHSFWPAGYQYLTPIPWLRHAILVYLGLGLLIASLNWILVAQAQMGQSWRIGIDPDHKAELVQSGVFRLSRNPIFLGMRLTLLGVFLVLPNAISLVVLVMGEALIQIQVRLEEEFLAGIYREAYQNYRRKTRRWL
jgi:protein-S-isoprenylcysteine O-methyltransferase Ste14